MAEQPGRITALDGMRGMAAVVVVVHHTLLTVPSFSAAYLAGSPAVRRGSVAWWLIYTPLHVFWAGPEAVTLFFVLSGLVLALPAARGAPSCWGSYYQRRPLRLILPVAGAVAFSAVMMVMFPRHPTYGVSAWLRLRPVTAHLTGVLSDVTLLWTPGRTVSVLWSLQWELVFSLALPLYLIVTRSRRGSRCLMVALGAISVAMVLVAPRHQSAVVGTLIAGLTYMPIFGVGVVMAFRLTDLAKTHIGDTPRRNVTLIGVAALLMASSRWLVLGFEQPKPALGLQGPVAALGTAGAIGASIAAILIAVDVASVRAWLSSPWLQWLGARSFSLYLLHEPIVIAFSYAFGGQPNPAVLLPISLAVALVAADIFHRGFESPTLRLTSRLVGRASPPISDNPSSGGPICR